VGFHPQTQEGRKSALENLNKQFAVDSATRAGIITNVLQAHLIDLDALHRFYNASIHVDRRQFTKFVASTLKTRPGVQAFEWIPRVLQSESPRFEAEARQDGVQGYHFYQLDSKGNHVPVEPREYYYPVYYVEPLAGNERAVGFDLGSNPSRLAALEQARDSGQPTVTSRITLVQETGAQAGFLILIPVYRQETPITTEGQRRLALKGFALGVFRAGDTIATATQPLPEKGLLTELVDLSAPADERLLYRNDKELRNLSCYLVEKMAGPGCHSALYPSLHLCGAAVAAEYCCRAILCARAYIHVLLADTTIRNWFDVIVGVVPWSFGFP